MPAQAELYRAIVAHVEAAARGHGVRITTVRRLALLVTGLVAAQSSVVSRMASGLWEVGVSAAQAASIGRRLRRGLADKRLTAAACYEPAVRTLLDWDGLRRRGKPAILALDESSQDERVHLLRVSLTYWGTAVPLAWEIWPQNTPLEAGEYWRRIDAVLDRVAALLPDGLAVILTADRAFDIPPFSERVAARGWHWVVRLKAEGANRFLDWHGREHGLKALVHRHVAAPGQRWKARGRLFKGAGWRAASVVAVWAPGAKERLVVITDLPPRWEVLAHYDRRFWIEPGFRTDKAHGWQWEACQVTALDHHARLLVAMAWATLLVLCLGLAQARTELARVAALRTTRSTARRGPPKPQHARASLFTLGLRLARRWLARTAAPPLAWPLSHLSSPAWNTRWRRAQARRHLFSQSVRP
jgi:DDE family transposase